MSKTDSQKLDMLLEAVTGLTQKITGIELEQKEIRKDINKTMLDVEILKDNQKIIIEGQQTATDQLGRKIDEAVEDLKEKDAVQDKAIYKLVQVK